MSKLDCSYHFEALEVIEIIVLKESVEALLTKNYVAEVRLNLWPNGYSFRLNLASDIHYKLQKQ